MEGLIRAGIQAVSNLLKSQTALFRILKKREIGYFHGIALEKKVGQNVNPAWQSLTFCQGN
jgi:hypothetical protein